MRYSEADRKADIDRKLQHLETLRKCDLPLTADSHHETHCDLYSFESAYRDLSGIASNLFYAQKALSTYRTEDIFTHLISHLQSTQAVVMRTEAKIKHIEKEEPFYIETCLKQRLNLAIKFYFTYSKQEHCHEHLPKLLAEIKENLKIYCDHTHTKSHQFFDWLNNKLECGHYASEGLTAYLITLRFSCSFSAPQKSPYRCYTRSLPEALPLITEQARALFFEDCFEELSPQSPQQSPPRPHAEPKKLADKCQFLLVICAGTLSPQQKCRFLELRVNALEAVHSFTERFFGHAEHPELPTAQEQLTQQRSTMKRLTDLEKRLALLHKARDSKERAQIGDSIELQPLPDRGLFRKQPGDSGAGIRRRQSVQVRVAP